MSTIKGGGDFPQHKPIHGQAPKLAKAEQSDSPFNTTDGLVLSGSGLKEAPDQSQVSRQPAEEIGSLAKGIRDAEANYGKPLNLIGLEACPMAEVDGQFLSGLVGQLQTTGIVLDPSSSGGVSEFAFTNGLNSRQLVSLNGQVLADANPFK